MANLTTKNPFTGEKIKDYPLDSFASSTEKFQGAQKAQKTWAAKPLSERLKLVEAALTYFEDNKGQIASDISQQMGRPKHQALGEIGGLLERARYMCSIAEETLAPDIIEDSETFYRAIEHAPLGVVFVISAWNYPLLITINGVIPALLSGNTVLLKHSSLTPEIGVHFENAFGTLGDVSGLLQNLIVDHQTTGKIIEDLDVNHVIFTGSVSGGRQILKHTSTKFLMPQLELGGKDAFYIHEDADLQHAAESVVDGAMFNSGQSCCGIERTYVHENVFDEFIKKAKALVDAYQLGDPSSSDTGLGPQAQAKSVDLMLSQIEQAKAGGAQVLSGGGDHIIGTSRFMQPTLLTGVNHTMDIIREENFGPLLPVMSVKGLDEAVSLINDSDYGLTSGIFTKNAQLAAEFAKGVNTGTVFMNRCDYLDPALPWTGVKNSGVGSSLSKYGFYGVTRRKAIHFKKKI